jgi:hypothetical protein
VPHLPAVVDENPPHSMKAVARFSLLSGVLCLLVAVLSSAVYYLHLRSSYMNAEFYEAFRAGLLDPNTPPEKIRAFALKAHDTIFLGYRALDAAVNLFTVVGVVASLAFLYIFRSLRSKRSDMP